MKQTNFQVLVMGILIDPPPPTPSSGRVVLNFETRPPPLIVMSPVSVNHSAVAIAVQRKPGQWESLAWTRNRAEHTRHGHAQEVATEPGFSN